MKKISIKQAILFRKLDKLSDEEFKEAFDELTYYDKKTYNEWTFDRLIKAIARNMKESEKRKVVSSEEL